ncbi:hypothetical protein M2475_001421, partial [Breznakia sp. PF5-3]|nr:hypothetical protein [Breznakia sp. PM6-1]MDF9824960.1 hypothetical protein [Breznakia sp. PM6-1]MDF9835662.1 hypothetical protein [Breznakia sp. PF5-3]MDF9835847.1 hypothetical protein [Breznakia sp. PF5-3]
EDYEDILKAFNLKELEPDEVTLSSLLFKKK